LAIEACLTRCQVLRNAGYEFCLTGLDTLDAATPEMLELASYLKLDITTLTPDALNALVFELRTTRKQLIANGVATREQMELCMLMGIDLFEGYYFAQADAVEGRKLNPSVQGIFRMIGQLMADADIEVLEAGFRTDPALVVNLLRLTNSVGVGARMRITSIRHAIAVLGRKQLLRWLQLLLFRQGNDADMGSNPLMQYAALRGRFLELLVERLHTSDKALLDQAFITGLISVLPAALGLPMREILEELATDNDVRLALLHREGRLGRLLALLDAYDNNDAITVTACLTEYPHAAPGDLARVLAQALEWVQALDQAAN
jgi:EAL and modified HD-GYP domain-containing signal transduction protein